jgi:transcriptional regulator with XRE-family HTH domain
MLGSRIAQRRRDLKLSQAKLAKRVGVSRQSINGWENGADLRISNLEKVARALKTTVAELAGGAA